VDKHLKRFAGCHGCPFQCMGFYDIPGIGAGGQMCVEAWYGFYSGGSSEGMWEGNIMSQKLGINNYEMHGLMDFIIAGVRGRAFTNDDLGLPFIPIRDYSFERKYGGQEKHHQFLQALLGGIADGTSPFHQGVARAAEQLGERAVRVYDTLYPAQGMRTHHIEGIGAALHRATDTRDPFDSCHDYTSCFGVNSYVARHFGVPGGYMNPSKNIYDGAEKETVWVQSHQSIKNSMPICDYASIPSLFFHPPQLDIRIFESQLISAVTGIEMDADKLWATGQRIWTLRRAIMALRENRTRDDDTLSHVWFERIPAGGQVLAKPIDTDEWEALKDRYYTLLGYNVSNGLPTRTILEGLGMKGVADELQKAGKLG